NRCERTGSSSRAVDSGIVGGLSKCRAAQDKNGQADKNTQPGKIPLQSHSFSPKCELRMRQAGHPVCVSSFLWLWRSKLIWNTILISDFSYKPFRGMGEIDLTTDIALK